MHCSSTQYNSSGNWHKHTIASGVIPGLQRTPSNVHLQQQQQQQWMLMQAAPTLAAASSMPVTMMPASYPEDFAHHTQWYSSAAASLGHDAPDAARYEALNEVFHQQKQQPLSRLQQGSARGVLQGCGAAAAAAASSGGMESVLAAAGERILQLEKLQQVRRFAPGSLISCSSIFLCFAVAPEE
jgi:hypothetical protein